MQNKCQWNEIAHTFGSEPKIIAKRRFLTNPCTGHDANTKLGIGVPGGTRTPDLLLRRQLLYPVELRALEGDAGKEMVGAVGFELTTLCSQSRCATRLRYAPTRRRIVALL